MLSLQPPSSQCVQTEVINRGVRRAARHTLEQVSNEHAAMERVVDRQRASRSHALELLRRRHEAQHEAQRQLGVRPHRLPRARWGEREHAPRDSPDTDVHRATSSHGSSGVGTRSPRLGAAASTSNTGIMEELAPRFGCLPAGVRLPPALRGEALRSNFATAPLERLMYF